jgi:hypothetical protein
VHGGAGEVEQRADAGPRCSERVAAHFFEGRRAAAVGRAPPGRQQRLFAHHHRTAPPQPPRSAAAAGARAVDFFFFFFFPFVLTAAEAAAGRARSSFGALDVRDGFEHHRSAVAARARATGGVREAVLSADNRTAGAQDRAIKRSNSRPNEMFVNGNQSEINSRKRAAKCPGRSLRASVVSNIGPSRKRDVCPFPCPGRG